MKTPILGQSYVARSPNAATSRMVNLFPESLVEGKDAAWLQRAPGLRKILTLGSGPIRGMLSLDGEGFIVSGSGFFKVSPVGSTYSVLTISSNISGVGPVSMSDNGTQIFIAANPDAYVYNKSGFFAQVTDVDFPGAVTVGYLDGYFVFNKPNSQQIWVTSILEGTQIDPLEFASAEGAPDNIKALIVDHREVWVFGSTSIEVWTNTGATDFPLQRIQGAFNEIGLEAVYSLAKLDNGLFWLGGDTRGNGIVYRSNGYTGTRISTHAVEWQIQSYPTISDAVAYTYQQDGHSFYVLNFPTANKTWVYDVATQMWHERASGNNNETRHRGNCQMVLNGQVVVGDFEDGRLYTYDLDTFSDDSAIQRWVRSWRALPPRTNSLKRTTHHNLQLDIEAGVGLDGNTLQGIDPKVMLRWSDDGGHTWSNEHWRDIGKLGEYGKRVIWHRLGSSDKLRDRVYEVSGTDPVKIAIMGAELQLLKAAY